MPYYVMHKLLAGLLQYHFLWRAAPPLEVAIRLAGHLEARVMRVLARGVEQWHTFLNQEVGGMSEALADLATATGNSSWLQLAALFERPCFVRPLMLHFQRRRGERQPPQSGGEVGRGASGGGDSLAARAIEQMHANTHLPQLLGTMARYEATGDAALRGAAEAFWRELSDGHQYAVRTHHAHAPTRAH